MRENNTNNTDKSSDELITDLNKDNSEYISQNETLKKKEEEIKKKEEKKNRQMMKIILNKRKSLNYSSF